MSRDFLYEITSGYPQNLLDETQALQFRKRLVRGVSYGKLTLPASGQRHVIITRWGLTSTDHDLFRRIQIIGGMRRTIDPRDVYSELIEIPEVTQTAFMYMNVPAILKEITGTEQSGIKYLTEALKPLAASGAIGAGFEAYLDGLSIHNCPDWVLSDVLEITIQEVDDHEYTQSFLKETLAARCVTGTMPMAAYVPPKGATVMAWPTDLAYAGENSMPTLWRIHALNELMSSWARYRVYDGTAYAQRWSGIGIGRLTNTMSEASEHIAAQDHDERIIEQLVEDLCDVFSLRPIGWVYVEVHDGVIHVEVTQDSGVTVFVTDPVIIALNHIFFCTY